MFDFVLSIALSGFALGAFLLGQGYSLRVKVNLPPYGRVNWRDISVILGGLALFPVALLAIPQIFVVAWIALGFFSSLAYLFRPMVKRLPIAASVSAATVASQFLFRQIWINDLITMLGVCFVAVYSVQGGITAREAAFLGLGYSVYDVLAIAFLQPLFSRSLVAAPLIPVIIVWYLGRGFLLGGADLLLLVLFALVLTKTLGWKESLAFVLLGVVVIFVLSGMAFTALPLAPFIVVIFLAVREAGRNRPANGVRNGV